MNSALAAIKHQDTVQSMMHVVSGRWVGAERTSDMSPLLATLYGRVYDLDSALQKHASGNEIEQSELPVHVATVNAVAVVLKTGREAARMRADQREIEILEGRVGSLKSFLIEQSPAPMAMAS